MPTVNMLAAKSNLSRLVKSVEDGAEAEIIIARNGKPAARIKHALGRAGATALSADQAVAEFQISGFAILDITAAHAAATRKLPLLHRNPFDRLLVAQALAGSMRLLTRDAQMVGYGGSIIRD